MKKTEQYKYPNVRAKRRSFHFQAVESTSHLKTTVSCLIHCLVFDQYSRTEFFLFIMDDSTINFNEYLGKFHNLQFKTKFLHYRA